MSDDARATLTDEEREWYACCLKPGLCKDEHFHERDVERIIAARVAEVTAERDAAVAQVEAVAALVGSPDKFPNPFGVAHAVLVHRFRAALTDPERVLAERDARVLDAAADDADRYTATLPDRIARTESSREAIRLLGVSDGRKGFADWVRDRARALREGQ